MLPGAGDELQGLKKGVVELADMIAINKADGDNLNRAQAAAAEYRAALHILGARSPHWSPPVVTYSALTGDGIAPLWAKVLEHHSTMSQNGELAARRREQQVKWLWAMLEERILGKIDRNAGQAHLRLAPYRHGRCDIELQLGRRWQRIVHHRRQESDPHQDRDQGEWVLAM